MSVYTPDTITVESTEDYSNYLPTENRMVGVRLKLRRVR